jgi:hypothetical protein
MPTAQKLKIRIEIGPDIPSQISPFQQPTAFAAVVTAALRALTVENLYPDAEFVGTKDGVTATLTIQKTDMGMTPSLPATFHKQFEGTITLEAPGG